MKDVKIQELTFTLTDAQARVKELTHKESFMSSNMEKLTAECTQLQEELKLV